MDAGPGRGDREERDLLRRCERALTTAGRAAFGGSRQQVRAAARRFVRRHRRNGSYLSFVLRSVLANSAIAVTLLGLSPSPAHARATLFTEITGASSPVNGLTPGNGSAPAVGDLNGDGKLDLVVGNSAGTFVYYKNVGTAIAPVFQLQTGTANPLNGVDVGIASAPALVDLDGDGDLDLVSGERYGRFLYFENTGSPTAPAFVQRTGTANPFNGLDAGDISAPAFADLDGDGDFDMMSGNLAGTFVYYKNVGTATAPAFQLQTGTNRPLGDIDVGSYSVPRFADLDGDGDLDLVVGNRDATFGALRYFENLGFPTQPAFGNGELLSIANPLADTNLGPYANAFPAFGDFDGDGDFDLVVGNSSNSLHYFKNLRGQLLVARTGTANPLNGFSAGAYHAAPAFGDLDGDGDVDMISGNVSGTFTYFQNTGNVLNPAAFVQRTGTANPLNGLTVGVSSVPTLGDIDGDGDLDLIAGEGLGTFLYFQNTGTKLAPAFVQRTGTANPMNGVDVGTQAAPFLVDVDGDGDLDLIAGRYTGDILYFENTGTKLTPHFVQRTGGANPFNGIDVGVYSRPALRDVDGDGDLDLVVGESLGEFFYFENTGSRTLPAYVARTGTANPLNGQDVLTFSGPALVDLDGDGDLDVVAGGSYGTFFFYENALVRPTPRYVGPNPVPFDGTDVGSFSSPAAGDLDGDGDPDFVASTSFGDGSIHYFQNIGSAVQPVVVERTGTANPFNGLNAGFNARLALADVDADGDLDLISGQNSGYGGAGTLFFENTGTATSPAFVARTGTGTANPFDGVKAGRAAPTFGDLDHDGDLDIVVGDFYGNFHYYENTGNAEAPQYVERTGTANPFNGLTTTNFATVALGDVDRDGDLDLVAGEESPGIFHYYENTGTRTTPAFVERTGTANPLDGKSVGADSSPTFVDLEGDGDLDVVSGESNGTLPTYYLPEPAAPAMLGAGAGLLGWLARWRRRKRT
ncbi:MAG TPA: FG-GAP-like repeat-containing protein [Myxococcota bacterium]|nr:FG-GAP-like repeat-containing protein [Myxococcota bacterium]